VGLALAYLIDPAVTALGDGVRVGSRPRLVIVMTGLVAFVVS
jgi:hypothetical protein